MNEGSLARHMLAFRPTMIRRGVYRESLRAGVETALLSISPTASFAGGQKGTTVSVATSFFS